MKRAKIHRTIYLSALALMGGCMVTSTWGANLMWTVLGVNWLLEGRWHEKGERFRQSRLLHAILVMFGVYVVALLWSSNLAEGLSWLQTMLPMLVVPLVVLTSTPVKGNARKVILWIYVTTVMVVSVIGLVRLLTIPGLPYRDAVPYISHIRYSLNCCMVIIIACGKLARGEGGVVKKAGLILLIAWMVVFLTLLRSYTAFGVLSVVAVVIIFCYRRRWQWMTALGVTAAVVSVLIVSGIRSYYQMTPLATEPLRPLTANGRPYLHLQDGLIENGNYVHNYICLEELQNEWARRSDVPFDSVLPSGYTIRGVLVRYMNGLGLTKDSVGMAALDDGQISEIVAGVENPVYSNGNIFKRMLYVSLFEYENLRCLHSSEGFSLLQRFALWNASWEVFKEHPWIGTGTGDLSDELHGKLQEKAPELSERITHPYPHSQYITTLTAFGIIGFSIILLFFLRASRSLRRQPPLMVAWLTIILLSFLTETTLGSLAGILFCTWFLAFRKETCTNTTHSTTESK